MRAPGRESFSREYYSKDTIKPQKPQQHSPKPLGNYHSSVVINQRTREGEAGTYGRQLHSQASSGDSHEQLLVKGRCSGLWEVSKGYLKYGNERERKKNHAFIRYGPPRAGPLHMAKDCVGSKRC